MCGIAGILTTGPDGGPLRAPLTAMRDALRHRGPDGEGLWQAPCGSAAFGHTRLAIFDPGEDGRQPLSVDGQYTITYNGALYNFLELRRELERRGVTFRTRTDTEVIVRAYEAYGPGCVARLRGMFAFALWDARDRSCLLARDRFGIKPLYYHERSGRLVFASEVRALIASGLIPRQANPQGVYGYLRTGSVPEPDTLLRDVFAFPAGHYAVWRAGRWSSIPYWTLEFTGNGHRDECPVERTRASLLDSVSCHLAGDQPVGVFLSGGVDSTALVALAHAAGHRDLRTFSMTFPGAANDEGPSARRTAARFSTRHEECAVDAAGAKALFPAYVAATDQPSIDGLNTFLISRFARERGMKVMWSGLGADELFGGYPSFARVPSLAAWHRRANYAGPLAQYAGRVVEALAPTARWRRIGDLLTQRPGLATSYEAFRGIFTRSEARLLTTHFAGPHAAREDGPASNGIAGDGVAVLELTRYARNQLLRDADAMSMAWGIELRTPFLDSQVVDTLSRISAADRLRPGKALLRHAVPEIPEWVDSAAKKCFQFPFAEWVNGEWGDVFDQSEQLCGIHAQTWYRKWSVFVLARWMERGSVKAHE